MHRGVPFKDRTQAERIRHLEDVNSPVASYGTPHKSMDVIVFTYVNTESVLNDLLVLVLSFCPQVSAAHLHEDSLIPFHTKCVR
jgi:hypothetical protein